MNINIIFSFILAGLLSIYLLFEPLKIKEENFGEVPLFEVKEFLLYELSPKGLSTFMKGALGVRYENRYEVQEIHFTDNSHKYLANMVAKSGIYEAKQVFLEGDVRYSRDDGFVFETQSASYNKETMFAYSHTEYNSSKKQSHIEGKWLEYDNKNMRIKSSDVVAVYNLDEEL